MASRQEAMAGARPAGIAHAFAPMSATRLLVFGGVALVLAGLIFGDIFAVFVLHQNAGRIGGHLLAATRAVAAEQPQVVMEHFGAIGSLLENRGTKVDTHVHIIAFGYLAIVIALIQPYVALSENARKRLAKLFLAGATLLPPSVFLIHYVGLKYSPLEAIGWASITADFGGFLVILACAGELLGLVRYAQGRHAAPAEENLLADRSWAARTLLAGGTLLVLAGFLHGGYYAWTDLYHHAAEDTRLLRAIAVGAASQDLAGAEQAVADYGALQGDKAVKVAAHAHVIEFGLLAMMLAFVQPYVYLSERWKRRWVMVLLAGSVMLPVFVLAEIRLGLLAGALADIGGLLVVIALLGMLAGILRYTGATDAGKGAAA